MISLRERKERIELAKTYSRNTNCASFLEFISGKSDSEFRLHPAFARVLFDETPNPSVDHGFALMDGGDTLHFGYIESIVNNQYQILERKNEHENITPNSLNKVISSYKKQFKDLKVVYFSLN